VTNKPNSLNLTSCELDPIHAPSAIQPFGALIAIENNFIVLASENCESVLGIPADNLLGKPYREVLGANCELLLEAVNARVDPTVPTIVKLAASKRWISATAFRLSNRIIIECELIEDDEIHEIACLKFVTQKHETVLSYMAFVAEGLRIITKFDRVMIYRFAEDWHGEVVAESKATNLSSFYGHHFPAGDIPEPARRLFTANWVRSIPNVGYQPIQLKSLPERDAKPLDLTLSALRSVSPIHLQYLENMGISGTLTLSIICDGRLWGLIACHHLTTRYLPAHVRSICGLIAKMVSSRVTGIEVASIIESRKEHASLLKAIQEEIITAPDLSDILRLRKHNLWKMIESDGFNLISKDYESSTSDGHALEPKQATELIKVLNLSSTRILHVVNVQKEFPEWKISPYCGGILAVDAGKYWLIWNKQETIRTVTWAGDPNKSEAIPGETLTPRASFADWQEQLKGTSTSWQPYEIDFAEQLYQIIFAGSEQTSARIEDPELYLSKLNIIIEEDLHGLKDRVTF
jgi:two-component system, chemotaxis family, sensor kinase Cph1